MSKQGHLALTSKIKRWNYDESVKKMRGIVKQWRSLTEETVRELYIAKEYLTNQEGQRRDPNAPNYILYTWGDYCEEIGFPRQLADYYIKKFTPKELSKNGKNVLQLEAPDKEEATAVRALQEARIEKVLSTGKRPSNWTDKEEAELKRRLESAKFAERLEKYNDLSAAITKTDWFADAMRRSKDIVNFKLETTEQLQSQMKIFRHIEAYLNVFEDPETKARAAFNLALKTRNLANELAEQNFQLKEAEHDG